MRWSTRDYWKNWHSGGTMSERPVCHQTSSHAKAKNCSHVLQTSPIWEGCVRATNDFLSKFRLIQPKGSVTQLWKNPGKRETEATVKSVTPWNSTHCSLSLSVGGCRFSSRHSVPRCIFIFRLWIGGSLVCLWLRQVVCDCEEQNNPNKSRHNRLRLEANMTWCKCISWIFFKPLCRAGYQNIRLTEQILSLYQSSQIPSLLCLFPEFSPFETKSFCTVQ